MFFLDHANKYLFSNQAVNNYGIPLIFITYILTSVIGENNLKWLEWIKLYSWKIEVINTVLNLVSNLVFSWQYYRC